VFGPRTGVRLKPPPYPPAPPRRRDNALRTTTSRPPARRRSESDPRRKLLRQHTLDAPAHPRYSPTSHYIPARRGRKLTKMECMVHYHEARVPFWNGKGSVAFLNAEKTREMIDGLKTKVKSRWEEQNGIY